MSRTLIRASQLSADVSGLVSLYGSGVFAPYGAGGVLSLNGLGGIVFIEAIGGAAIIVSGSTILFSGGAGGSESAGFTSGYITGNNLNVGGSHIFDLTQQFTAALGGFDNIISGEYPGHSDSSVILGGQDNRIEAWASAALAGYENLVSGGNSVTLGGSSNKIYTYASAAIGGYSNIIDEFSSSCVVMGDNGVIRGSSSRSSILAGGNNTIVNSSSDSSILCGGNNLISGADDSAILGGENNTISSTYYATILGGYHNHYVGGGYGVIGGSDNIISGSAFQASILGGYGNFTCCSYSFIGGGTTNYISLDGNAGYCDILVGGSSNSIQGTSQMRFIGNGSENLVSGDQMNTILNGTNNSAITADIGLGHGTILNGYYCTVSGTLATVINGAFAKAKRCGEVAFGDSNPSKQESQVSILQWNGDTTDDSVTELTIGVAGAYGFIEPGEIWVGHVDYLGVKTDFSTKIYGRIHFTLQSDSSGNVSLEDSYIINSGGSSYSFFLSGNNDGKRLSPIVSGAAGDNVSWKASAYFQQLKI